MSELSIRQRLSNKHVIAALLITPLLALGGYFVAGFWVNETPHAAKADGQYRLVAKSNCRYSSGQCELQNGDFKLLLTSKKNVIEENTNEYTNEKNADPKNHSLLITSAHPLDHLALTIEQPSDNPAPQQVKAIDSTRLIWRFDNITVDSGHRLFLVAQIGTTYYFSESDITFLLPGNN